jgi:outer membrane protein, multidrug efflux system
MCLRSNWPAKCNDIRTLLRKRITQLIHSACIVSFWMGCPIALVSCANLAGPDYERPDTPTKKTWSQVPESQVSATETIRPDWWTGFGDPYLNDLIQKAISGSFDLKILAARIDVAGVAVGAERVQTLPKVSGTSSSEFGTLTSESQKQGGSDVTKQYNSSTSVSWEIDLWGKIRKGFQSKRAEYRASEADWRAGYLTLVSDVATKYFEIRQLDEQIEQQRITMEFNNQLLSIYSAQYKEGLVAESELLSQQAEIDALTKDMLDLQRQRQVAELNLATLLGIPAGDLKVPVAPLMDSVQSLDVPAGLPSDLLARRPDIVAAEYKVLAAHELVGQARLAKLPSISLTGSAGSASNALSEILKTWTFGLGPSITTPIFDPSVDANLKTDKASAKVAEEEYRRTVVKAFEEVETALTNLASRKRQKKLLEEQIRNLTVVRDVRYALLQEGLVSQLEVFDTDRTLLSAQQTLLQTHQQILSDTVTLYKAVGGGWPKEYVSP